MLTNKKILLKTNFKIENTIENIYTGGKVLISSDGTFLICQCGEQLKIINIKNGKNIKNLDCVMKKINYFNIFF